MNETRTPSTTAVGTVVSTSGHSAVVEVDAEICPRCAAGQGCGAGLFASGAPTVTMTIPVEERLDVTAGDHVYLSLSPGSLLRAALCLYGLPLAGLLLGTAAGTKLPVAEAFTGIVGLLAGLALGRWVSRRDPCLSTLRPTVSGLAGDPSPSMGGEQP